MYLFPVSLLFVAAIPARAATLDEALRAAEQGSVDLQLVEAKTDATRTLPAQAWSLLVPKVIAGGSYTLNEREIALDFAEMAPEFAEFISGDPIVVQPKDAWQASVTVQQSLFSGEALPLLIGAYHLVDAAEADEADAKDQIRLGVVRAYYGLYTAREGVALAEQAESTATAEVGLAERRLSAETGTTRAVLQAQLTLSQAKRQVAVAREQQAGAEDAFAQLTGLPRDTPLSLPPPPTVPDDLVAAIATARTEQPAVQAAVARIGAARMQQKANLAGWAPDVTGRFTWAYSENTGFSTDKTPWMAVVEGQWVLWDGGYRLAKSREYAEQTHMAELARDRAAITAESDVRAAWERFHRAEAAVEAVKLEQSLAEASLDLAKRGLEAEQVTWHEVEQAELGVRAVRLAALVEQMNRDIAGYQLLVATGRW